MPWLGILTLVVGLAAAGTASAAVYVPGAMRDGVYTRPHFLDSPAVRYDRAIRLDPGQDQPPKPTINDQPLPAQKLLPEASHPDPALPVEKLPRKRPPEARGLTAPRPIDGRAGRLAIGAAVAAGSRIKLPVSMTCAFPAGKCARDRAGSSAPRA